MEHHTKTKIVATIGPSSESEEAIEKLIKAGVNVVRLNFAHREWDYFDSLIKRIRQVEKKVGKPIGILGDVPGPKIRIGEVEKDQELKIGDRVLLTKQKVLGSRKVLSVNFPEILAYLKPHAEIYLADGLIKLEIEKIKKEGAIARVTGGGVLRSKMGFSAQGMALNSFALTSRDRLFIKKSGEANLDMVAVSFVQKAADIQAVIKLLPKKNRPMVIAKIETAGAIENAEAIMNVADGMMIARGDLGFSIPYPELPHAQKKLINLCLKNAKPVITATQMLESMIQNHFPTRAEVSDVANAILDGTDAVMLSAETAIGQFPDETVKTMKKIIDESGRYVKNLDFIEEKTTADAVAASAVKIADQINARLIIVFTHSGMTAKRIARHRTTQPIIALSPSKKTIRELTLSWGVQAVEADLTEDIEQLVIQAKKIIKDNTAFNIKKGELFVISAGLSFTQSGGTNLILIEKI